MLKEKDMVHQGRTQTVNAHLALGWDAKRFILEGSRPETLLVAVAGKTLPPKEWFSCKTSAEAGRFPVDLAEG
jgi:hypothetical protein